MIPVFNLGDFSICFEAEDEDISARTHFIKECGWTESQFRKIKDYPFFCARVSIWRDGVEFAADYLGCCSYKTEKDFYTKYRSDYFADMVSQCVEEANNAELSALFAQWHEKMKKEHAAKLAQAQKEWAEKQAKQGVKK